MSASPGYAVVGGYQFMPLGWFDSEVVSRRGISVLDLVTGTVGTVVDFVLPDSVENALASLAVLELSSTTTPTSYVHEGVTQSVGDQPIELPLKTWTVEAPVATTGMPFRMVRARATADAGQNVEPASTLSYLDLYLDPVAVTIPGLVAAQVVGGTFGSAEPAHLLPDPKRSGVRLWGRAVLRLTFSPFDVAVVDWPDPFDPQAPEAAVTELSFDPPTFLVGTSGFGAAIDRLIVDTSATATPAIIQARDHDATWQGISLRQGTLYFPRNAPIVGDLSMGVHDLLVGMPPSNAGLQGDAVVELGRTGVNPATVTFVDRDGGLDPPEVNAAGYMLVRLRAATEEVKATALASGNWTLPDGTTVKGATTSGWFVASAGQSMTVALNETLGNAVVPGEDLAFVFTLDITAGTPAPPEIDVGLATGTLNDAASISGSAEALADLSLATDADGAEWSFGSGAATQQATGPSFTPDFAVEVGSYDLTLSSDGRTRRCDVQVLDSGALVVGTAAGVRDGQGQPLAATQLLATYDRARFDRDDLLVSAGSTATITSDGGVTVPPGALAHVSVDGPPPPVEALRHVQVLMLFNQATAAPDQFMRTDGTLVDAPTHVAEWAASFDGATFFVVGRCCDLGADDYNAELARQRAILAASWIAAGAATRGEQDPATGDLAGLQREAGLSTDEQAETRLINRVAPGIAGTDSTTPPRPAFRRADIYAVGGQPTDATPPAFAELAPAGAARDAYVPGEDVSDLPPSPTSPQLPYRARLTAGWDSPTVHDVADAVPTLAELLLAWSTDNVALTGAGAIDVKAGSTGTGQLEVLTLVGRWTHDPQSGQTLFTFSLDSTGDPDGLAHVDNPLLGTALAFAPALLATLQTTGPLVDLAVLAGGAALLSTIVTDATTVLHGIEYQIEPLQGGPLQRLVVDYSVALTLDSSRLTGVGVNIRTDPNHPMRVRYHNVGLEFDLSGSKPWDQTVRLVFDDVSFEIEDPGGWTIDGPLGELLRVVGTRAGVGSSWVEVDLEFLIDLGIVSISGATVRVTIDDAGTLSVDLRGISVGVDIPGVLQGQGTLTLGADGAFRASIAVSIVPAGLTVKAALALAGSFFFLDIEALLPVGIPLGPTGLGVYGFVGRFVSNGTRAIDTSIANVVQRELSWYRDLAPQDKYRQKQGQWALGLGAVVGTALDTGFSFNSTGMFVVAFPDPSVVFAVESHFLIQPSTATDDPGPVQSAAGEITGLAVIQPGDVTVAVDGQFVINPVLDLHVPVGAHFTAQPADTYVRIGANGVEGRTGQPVTATLLPGTLHAHGWSYLMIEPGGLQKLGGDPRFSFDGFAVGFGAGWSLDWSTGPVSLHAAASVLVGLGTKPFMLVGGVFLEGEVSVAFVSAGVTAELVATVQGSSVSLAGEACATLDLGFCQAEKCVSISIGPSVQPTAPPPSPPLVKASVVDRSSLIVATIDAEHPSATSAVWPDTVVVLEFTHPLTVALPASSAFQPGPAPAGPEWSGTSKLKYAYRLTAVELRQAGAALGGPLDSAWWWSTSRPGVVADGDLALSSEEGRWLALLSWDPRPWARVLTGGGEGSPGDPAVAVGRLCDPDLVPTRVCALGVDAVRIDAERIELRNDTPTTTLPARLAWRAHEHFGSIDLADVVSLAAARRWRLETGGTRSLAQLDEGGFYEIGVLSDQLGPVLTLQLTGAYEPAAVDPTVTLLTLPWTRVPVGAHTVCVGFPLPSSVDITPDGFDFEGLHFVDLGQGGLRIVEQLPAPETRQLAFSRQGVRIEFPVPVRGADLDVASLAAAVIASASSAAGEVVDTAICPAGQRTTLRLASTAGIASVVLAGGGGEGLLVSICVVDPLLGSPEVPEDGPFPVVTGTRSDGPAVVWPPTVVGTVSIAGIDCSIVRYDPPAAGRTWVRSDILPWTRGRVGVISTCAVSAVAQQLADDQQSAIDHVVDSWNALAGSALPERHDLLQADTTYTVHVEWQYQAWMADEDSAVPPPIDPDGWLTGGSIDWSFTTAVLAAPTTDAVDLRDESSFDPRAVARYLIGLDPPGGDGRTHFLDDPLHAFFAVDHVEELLGCYDQTLSFSVRRTDPPPGGGGVAAHQSPTPTYRPLPAALSEPGDARFVAAAAALPCVQLPPLGGTAARLDVVLEPRAHYDLVLSASAATGTDDSPIAVVNFATSRYGSPTDLLDALGLRSVTDPVLPYNAVVGEPRRTASWWPATLTWTPHCSTSASTRGRCRAARGWSPCGRPAGRGRWSGS